MATNLPAVTARGHTLDHVFKIFITEDMVFIEGTPAHTHIPLV